MKAYFQASISIIQIVILLTVGIGGFYIVYLFWLDGEFFKAFLFSSGIYFLLNRLSPTPSYKD